MPEVLDVVNTQKHLLEQLGITHLKAVMGPSFGAMTSWQWAVAYPDMMDAIIRSSARRNCRLGRL